MYSLIILGMVPGTDIQLTFTAWLVATEALAMIYMLRKMARRQTILKFRLLFAFLAMPHRVPRALQTQRII